MFCPKCGKESKDGAAFCGGCGAKLPALQGNQQDTISDISVSITLTNNGSVAKSARKTGRIQIIIGAVVVLVVAIAAFMTNGFGLMGPIVRNSVNDYSWNDLSKISQEISTASDDNAAMQIAKHFNLVNSEGKLDGTQRKEFQLNNGILVQAQITGFRHDDKVYGGKAGITFIFGNAIGEREMNSSDTNHGGWGNSDLRYWLASEGMDLIPKELQELIVSVKKKTNNTGETESLSSVTTTEDKLWLFSLKEVIGDIPKEYFIDEYEIYADIHNMEGTEYQLFRDLNVNPELANEVLVRRWNETSVDWWLRSPYQFSDHYSGDFRAVSSEGFPYRSLDANESEGVVPGFCI